MTKLGGQSGVFNVEPSLKPYFDEIQNQLQAMTPGNHGNYQLLMTPLPLCGA